LEHKLTSFAFLTGNMWAFLDAKKNTEETTSASLCKHDKNKCEKISNPDRKKMDFTEWEILQR
jgi:hypothetical protein